MSSTSFRVSLEICVAGPRPQCHPDDESYAHDIVNSVVSTLNWDLRDSTSIRIHSALPQEGFDSTLAHWCAPPYCTELPVLRPEPETSVSEDGGGGFDDDYEEEPDADATYFTGSEQEYHSDYEQEVEDNDFPPRRRDPDELALLENSLSILRSEYSGSRNPDAPPDYNCCAFEPCVHKYRDLPPAYDFTEAALAAIDEPMQVD